MALSESTIDAITRRRLLSTGDLDWLQARCGLTIPEDIKANAHYFFDCIDGFPDYFSMDLSHLGEDVPLPNVTHIPALVKHTGSVPSVGATQHILNSLARTLELWDAEGFFTHILYPLKGFYLGSFDLEGRHPERYRRALSSLETMARLCVDISRTLKTSDASGARSNSSRTPIWWRDLGQNMAIAAELDDLRTCLAVHAEPRFQRLSFLHLPVELLDLTLEGIGVVRARTMRHVCKTLNEVCKRYVYQARRVVLICAMHEPGTENPTFDLYDMGRDKFLQKVDALRVRTDIMCCLRHLQISARGLRFLEAGFDDLARESITRATPIWLRVGTLLQHTRELESLSLDGFVIDNNLSAIIMQLPKLHTLELETCDLSLDPTAQLASSTSILNLIIRGADSFPVHTEHHVLFASIPKLRYLLHSGSVLTSRIMSTTMPNHVEVFHTLEQLQLYAPDFDEISDIASWIGSGSRITHNHLRLTHFRLMAPHDLGETEIGTLLNVLREAPLRFLSLEGLYYAEPELFVRIATACPGLEDLTLAYSHHNANIASSSTWPHLAQDYAPHFAGFSKLKRFSSNYAFPTVMYSPAIMLNFEEGFGAHKGLPFQCPEDVRNMFYMFAAYAQTLETLDFWGSMTLERRTDGSVREADGIEDADPNEDAPSTKAGYIVRPKPSSPWPPVSAPRKF